MQEREIQFFSSYTTQFNLRSFRELLFPQTFVFDGMLNLFFHIYCVGRFNRILGASHILEERNEHSNYRTCRDQLGLRNNKSERLKYVREHYLFIFYFCFSLFQLCSLTLCTYFLHMAGNMAALSSKFNI